MVVPHCSQWHSHGKLCLSVTLTNSLSLWSPYSSVTLIRLFPRAVIWHWDSASVRRSKCYCGSHPLQYCKIVLSCALRNRTSLLWKIWKVRGSIKKRKETPCKVTRELLLIVWHLSVFSGCAFIFLHNLNQLVYKVICSLFLSFLNLFPYVVKIILLLVNGCT